MWDGKGLPPGAQQRLDRAAQSGLATSLLTAASAAALKSVGLEPVGEVMGCKVMQISWAGYAAMMGYDNSIYLASTSRVAGFRPLYSALQEGIHGALSRVVAEAVALQADGVVGLRLVDAPLEAGIHEFMLLGTAVRADSRHRPTRPFTTDLPGTDVAKAMLAGWVPVGFHVTREIATRASDWFTMQQRSLFAGNVEITSLSELMASARAGARAALQQRVRADGADGAVVSSMSAQFYAGDERNSASTVHSVITATTIARFGATRRPAPQTLTIMPLNSKGNTR